MNANLRRSSIGIFPYTRAYLRVIGRNLFLESAAGVVYRTGTKTNWVTYRGVVVTVYRSPVFVQEDDFYQSRVPILLLCTIICVPIYMRDHGAYNK